MILNDTASVSSLLAPFPVYLPVMAVRSITDSLMKVTLSPITWGVEITRRFVSEHVSTICMLASWVGLKS